MEPAPRRGSIMASPPPVPDRPLTLPLLVRGSFDNGAFIASCVLSLVFVGIACYTAFRERTADPLLFFLPIAAFAGRLTDSLARRTAGTLGQGASLTGEGWRLDAAGLRTWRALLPLSEITHAGFYDEHLCVWRGADERPALRIPQEGRNVHP